MQTRCRQVVRAMGPIEKALTDWTAYADVLTTDEDLDPALEATMPILLLLFKEAAQTTNKDCDAVSARDTSYDDDDDGGGAAEKRKRTKQRKNVEESEGMSVKLSAVLGKALAPMLQRFGAHAAPLRAVLALPILGGFCDGGLGAAAS